MQNRIDKKFKELKKRKKKAFIAFITAGDPDLKTTRDLVLAFEKAGVDIVELGVPFSDPLADGPTIQASSQRALSQHVNLEKICQTVRVIRRNSQIPLVLMTYYNPIFHYGEERFFRLAKECGVDGVIIPDLPPEEAKSLAGMARAKNIAVVFFIAPTTTRERMKRIVKASSGFIYYVSLTGVTGARQKLPTALKQDVRFIKQVTDKPVCVGFGVSTPAQVKMISRLADGVIVGSAIVNCIASQKKKVSLIPNVAGFVSRFTGVLSK